MGHPDCCPRCWYVECQCGSLQAAHPSREEGASYIDILAVYADKLDPDLTPEQNAAARRHRWAWDGRGWVHPSNSMAVSNYWQTYTGAEGAAQECGDATSTWESLVAASRAIGFELDELRAATVPAEAVRGLAERLTERRDQCDRLGRVSQSVIIQTSMAGRAEVYEEVTADLLALLPPASGEKGGG